MDQVPGLQAALEQAFELLAEGALQAGSPFHTPTLATSGPGAPGLRTVVLRRFLPADRQVEFHTDARSPKMSAIAADPAVSLHFWDPGRRVQLHVHGLAAVLSRAAAAQIWRRLPPQTQATYAVSLPPGTPIAAPADAARSLDPAAALAVFRAVRVGIDELEWLHLAPGQHRRARFTWANGVAASTWLVP